MAVLNGCVSVQPAETLESNLPPNHPSDTPRATLLDIETPDPQVVLMPLPVAHVEVDSALILIPEPVQPERVATPLAVGVASYYGARFAGRRTASGERFNPNELTAAHRTLPFGTLVRVSNPNTGKSVVVRINDRGPFSHGRIIDLSYAAAEEIGMIRSGTARVELELLSENTD